MATRKRKRDDEGGGGGSNWMDTYGDLVTLLLTFFVLLFSFSSMDAQKWQTLVGAFSGSTAIAIPVLSPDMVRESPIERVSQESQEDDASGADANSDYLNFMELYGITKEYIEENDINAEIYADYNSYVITLRFRDNVLFESGRAEILSDAKPVMDHIVNIITTNDDLIKMVKIEGHTDNRPIHTAQFEDNWALSIVRASNVLRYFISSGSVNESKLSATGYGEYQPVESNDTAEGQAVNRRVDFLIESVREADIVFN